MNKRQAKKQAKLHGPKASREAQRKARGKWSPWKLIRTRCVIEDYDQCITSEPGLDILAAEDARFFAICLEGVRVMAPSETVSSEEGSHV